MIHSVNLPSTPDDLTPLRYAPKSPDSHSVETTYYLRTVKTCWKSSGTIVKSVNSAKNPNWHDLENSSLLMNGYPRILHDSNISMEQVSLTHSRGSWPRDACMSMKSSRIRVPFQGGLLQTGTIL
jgi:hypothetical protein